MQKLLDPILAGMTASFALTKSFLQNFEDDL
jgi:hypothetical protein